MKGYKNICLAEHTEVDTEDIRDIDDSAILSCCTSICKSFPEWTVHVSNRAAEFMKSEGDIRLNNHKLRYEVEVLFLPAEGVKLYLKAHGNVRWRI